MVALVGSQSPYTLDKDADVGFRESLANNQLNLALHYLVVRLEEMDAEIQKLRGEAPTTDPEPKPLDEAPPIAKATTKKATAKKTSTRKKKVEAEEIPGATPVSEPKADEDE